MLYNEPKKLLPKNQNNMFMHDWQESNILLDNEITDLRSSPQMSYNSI